MFQAVSLMYKLSGLSARQTPVSLKVIFPVCASLFLELEMMLFVVVVVVVYSSLNINMLGY